jgi:uncharacterized phage protein (TIGR02218 family)
VAFDILERSIFGGKPLELYEFSVPGQYWRYTTEDRIVTFNSADFTPVADLGRGSIKVTQNIERGELEIRMRGDTPLALEYIAAPPSVPVVVKIFRKHRGDPDYIIRWRGRVQNCEWDDNFSHATLQCTQSNWSLRQPGLRLSYQYACPYNLYGVGCDVNQADFEVIATVVSISGLNVELSLPSSFADGYFAGGYMLWEGATGRQETRMITGSSGSAIAVQLSTIGISPGDSLRLYPGCDHSSETCRDKFNNIDNYLGFEFIPTVNPFAGATIF